MMSVLFLDIMAECSPSRLWEN